MTAYIASGHDLRGLAGLAIALAMLFAIGAWCGGRELTPEAKLLAGWGVLCLVLTAWGVATPFDLRLPLEVLAVGALAVVLVPGARSRIGPLGAVGRMLLMLLPAWLVMAALQPSEIDTWLNLLPNAAYLFDHGVLPASGRPPDFSFLPLAPYNTQFVAFAASVASGDFADGVMGLFNLALLGAAALTFARAIATGDAASAATPPWWACATGFLLVAVLNPGFAPRVFLSPYGEAALAVTLLYAVWLAAETLHGLAEGRTWPRAGVALALVLAAMVDIKQSGLGLVLPVGGTMLAIALAHPAIPARRALGVTAAILLPALALYALWRLEVATALPDAELRLRPVSAWNWTILPGILGGILHAIAQRATLFVLEGAVLVLAVRSVLRGRWGRETMLHVMVAGTILLFNLFLLFTYVAHFPPEWALDAHSYFRYSSQLSLAVMLALVVAFRPWAQGLATRLPAARTMGRAAVLATVVLPLVCVKLLRFDLDAPQPQLRRIASETAPRIAQGERLAMLLPGDVDDSVGSMLRGLLLFTPPRRPTLDVTTATTADQQSLDAAAADGISLALVSCAPAGLADAPSGEAALLRREGTRWHTVAHWPYPADLPERRFGAMLARAPVCGAKRAPGAAHVAQHDPGSAVP